MYQKDDPKSIQALFGSIAKRYDRSNAFLSLGLYKRWNRQLVAAIQDYGMADTYLDLCSGTGAIVSEYLALAPSTHVTLIDFCQEMLEEAKKRFSSQGAKHTFNYLQADVQKIPLPDHSQGAATLAYGIRNVANPRKCIQEVYRVLKPNSPFGILELTRPSNVVLRFIHRLYLKTALPLIGSFFTKNKNAYTYLRATVSDFLPPTALEQLLVEEGFSDVHQIKLFWGVATLFIGVKG